MTSPDINADEQGFHKIGDPPEKFQAVEAYISELLEGRWGEETDRELVAKMTEELGEVAGAVNKLKEGRTTLQDVQDEIGDLLISLSRLAGRHGWELHHLRAQRLKVIKQRLGVADEEAEATRLDEAEVGEEDVKDLQGMWSQNGHYYVNSVMDNLPICLSESRIVLNHQCLDCKAIRANEIDGLLTPPVVVEERHVGIIDHEKEGFDWEGLGEEDSASLVGSLGWKTGHLFIKGQEFPVCAPAGSKFHEYEADGSCTNCSNVERLYRTLQEQVLADIEKNRKASAEEGSPAIVLHSFGKKPRPNDYHFRIDENGNLVNLND